ncbi:hypothetical protein J7359_15340 [Paracoccus sp. R12_2]|nr:hypothetical protein [Paracoccus sp. R12_2]
MSRDQQIARTKGPPGGFKLGTHTPYSASAGIAEKLADRRGWQARHWDRN